MLINYNRVLLMIKKIKASCKHNQILYQRNLIPPFKIINCRLLELFKEILYNKVSYKLMKKYLMTTREKKMMMRTMMIMMILI